jgi:hypothetical protein
MDTRRLAKSLARTLRETGYTLVARGTRDVGYDEFVRAIQIIIDAVAAGRVERVQDNLRDLFRYHPDTIALSESQQESCPAYIKGQCDCFMPDVATPYCVRKKSLNVRSSPSYVAWRNAILRRDGRRCVKCGKSRGTLHAHHIKAYKDFPELRLEVSNGETLCEDCHKEEHASKKTRVRATA